jgi:hypothetical protein
MKRYSVITPEHRARGGAARKRKSKREEKSYSCCSVIAMSDVTQCPLCHVPMTLRELIAHRKLCGMVE